MFIYLFLTKIDNTGSGQKIFFVSLSHFLKLNSLSFSLPIRSSRLFGMTGVIRTNISDPHTLGLHTHVCWPDFINPFVLLLLYYTLIALLHKWIHLTEEMCETVSLGFTWYGCCLIPKRNFKILQVLLGSLLSETITSSWSRFYPIHFICFNRPCLSFTTL